MGDKEYLLMYQDKNGVTYAWFNTENEMINFVREEDRIHVIEGIRVIKHEKIFD